LVKFTASELTQIGPADALAICLRFLDREPELLPRAATL
jgi:hypothetical protein